MAAEGAVVRVATARRSHDNVINEGDIDGLSSGDKGTRGL
jgi:hypothetical protein